VSGLRAPTSHLTPIAERRSGSVYSPPWPPACCRASCGRLPRKRPTCESNPPSRPPTPRCPNSSRRARSTSPSPTCRSPRGPSSRARSFGIPACCWCRRAPTGPSEWSLQPSSRSRRHRSSSSTGRVPRPPWRCGSRRRASRRTWPRVPATRPLSGRSSLPAWGRDRSTSGHRASGRENAGDRPRGSRPRAPDRDLLAPRPRPRRRTRGLPQGDDQDRGRPRDACSPRRARRRLAAAAQTSTTTGSTIGLRRRRS
jgi:hypothetical protein